MVRLLNFLKFKKSRFGKIVRCANAIKLGLFSLQIITVLLISLTGCDNEPWNDPYPHENPKANTLYRSFSERPKHLDPARSYSESESPYIGQIYEPPYQYHYLKRPYELEPLTAEAMPEVHYYDASGKEVPENTDANNIHHTDYIIRIKPGILYQPHPAFAKDSQGTYSYLNLSLEQSKSYHVLSDFKEMATRELIAEDYVYEIKRLAEPHVSSPIYGLMSRYIVGLKDLREKIMLKTEEDKKQNKNGVNHGLEIDLRPFNLEGATVLDRYTYRVRIYHKYPPFLYWFAMNFFAPLPWEVAAFYAQPGLEAHNITLDWYPVGTGPYQMTENNPDYRITLIKNPNYREEFFPTVGAPGDAAIGLLQDQGKRIPFIDKVTFTLEKEDIPGWTKFLQGYYDLSGISSDNFNSSIRFSGSGKADVSEELKEHHIRLQTSVGTNVFYWGFNMLDETVGGYSDKARILRQSISQVFDVPEFITLFMNGRGEIANGPIPQDIDGYEKQPKRVRISYEEAKKRIAKAGYKDLTLYLDTGITGNPDEISLHAWLQQQFEKMGIHLVIRGSDYNRYQDKIMQGGAQLFFFGWNADYPDPENFLFLFYGPNSSVQYGGENNVNYRNAEFDKLFERMRTLKASPERSELIGKMISLLEKDTPWIWGFYPKSYVLYHEWMRIGKPGGMVRNNLKYARLNPDLRAMSLHDWNQPIIWPMLLLITFCMLICVPAILIWWQRKHSPWKRLKV